MQKIPRIGQLLHHELVFPMALGSPYNSRQRHIRKLLEPALLWENPQTFLSRWNLRWYLQVGSHLSQPLSQEIWGDLKAQSVHHPQVLPWYAETVQDSTWQEAKGSVWQEGQADGRFGKTVAGRGAGQKFIEDPD